MPTVEYQITNTPQQQLAQDLAMILGDTQNLHRYLRYVNDYPESFLRTTLSEVLTFPKHKIRKSKAALFHFLINKYGKAASHCDRY